MHRLFQSLNIVLCASGPLAEGFWFYEAFHCLFKVTKRKTRSKLLLKRTPPVLSFTMLIALKRTAHHVESNLEVGDGCYPGVLLCETSELLARSRKDFEPSEGAKGYWVELLRLVEAVRRCVVELSEMQWKIRGLVLLVVSNCRWLRSVRFTGVL